MGKKTDNYCSFLPISRNAPFLVTIRIGLLAMPNIGSGFLYKFCLFYSQVTMHSTIYLLFGTGVRNGYPRCCTLIAFLFHAGQEEKTGQNK
jgi:hypothetical protein